MLERIDEWDTWEDVPEGVVVTVFDLFCHYRKNQGVVEFSDPENDPDWTKAAVRTMPCSYGPWTRVTDGVNSQHMIERTTNMRQIKASEVKPGMRVKFTLEGWDMEATVGTVIPDPLGVELHSDEGSDVLVGANAEVTVLSEPRPEEPTGLGARIVVDGQRVIRAPSDETDPQPWFDAELNWWYTWGELCNKGLVRVIEANPSWD